MKMEKAVLFLSLVLLIEKSQTMGPVAENLWGEAASGETHEQSERAEQRQLFRESGGVARRLGGEVLGVEGVSRS